MVVRYEKLDLNLLPCVWNNGEKLYLSLIFFINTTFVADAATSAQLYAAGHFYQFISVGIRQDVTQTSSKTVTLILHLDITSP